MFFPVICFWAFVPVLLGNLAANFIRNWWASAIIFCGHFPEDVQTFTLRECENESKGHWYYRQMVGSANFSGSKFLHVMSGHLSLQIEHHLFPEIPAHRYPAIAEQVQRVAEKHGIPSNTASFWRQYGTVLKKIFRYALPNRAPRDRAIYDSMPITR